MLLDYRPKADGMLGYRSGRAARSSSLALANRLAAATICVFSETDPGASSVNVRESRSRSDFLFHLHLFDLRFSPDYRRLVLQGAYEN